jgi:hypothetical protein
LAEVDQEVKYRLYTSAITQAQYSMNFERRREEGTHLFKTQYMTQAGAVKCNIIAQVLIQVYSAVEVPIVSSSVNSGSGGSDLQ